MLPPIPEEEFVFIPRYDNFTLFFDEGGLADIHREQQSYLGLLAENPDLASTLRAELKKLQGRLSNETLQPYNHLLYQAYLIMRKYVTRDKELDIYRPDEYPDGPPE